MAFESGGVSWNDVTVVSIWNCDIFMVAKILNEKYGIYSGIEQRIKVQIPLILNCF